MLLAHGIRRNLENIEFILLCSLMFVIALFGFILLLIDDSAKVFYRMAYT